MEKELFHTLYKHVRERDVKDFPSNALSGLLHGYLSVYSMVRVYPWLEDEFGSPWDIHERVREIARTIQLLLKDYDIPVDERAGHVVDLMDTYLLYSDMSFLETALDAAYEILIPKGSNKIVLPCRTPNICRMLCNCYYFTGEVACSELARGLEAEALGCTRDGDCSDLLVWWDAICLYEDVMIELPAEEQERLNEERGRLRIRIELEEGERIVRFRQLGQDADLSLVTQVFYILAKREFDGLNKTCK